jgi:hypothetical protein
MNTASAYSLYFGVCQVFFVVSTSSSVAHRRYDVLHFRVMCHTDVVILLVDLPFCFSDVCGKAQMERTMFSLFRPFVQSFP